MMMKILSLFLFLLFIMFYFSLYLDLHSHESIISCILQLLKGFVNDWRSNKYFRMDMKDEYIKKKILEALKSCCIDKFISA